MEARDELTLMPAAFSPLPPPAVGPVLTRHGSRTPAPLHPVYPDQQNGIRRGTGPPPHQNHSGGPKLHANIARFPTDRQRDNGITKVGGEPPGNVGENITLSQLFEESSVEYANLRAQLQKNEGRGSVVVAERQRIKAGLFNQKPNSLQIMGKM